MASGAVIGSASAMIVDDDGGWRKETKDDNDELAEAVVEEVRAFGKRKESPPPEDEKPRVIDAPFAEGLVASAQLKTETVYRGVVGRKIDMRVERVETACKKRKLEEREAQKMEWGEWPRAAQRKRDLAVYADDRELNDEQKAKDRWNDPAAAFLTRKARKGPKKPLYSGPPPPPNRFGIRPGYRWDGVDRGNGYEKKIQKQNECKRTDLESYQWSVDDM
ncbi:Pre-mRNA-splicing factor of RES complex-domain-containing protein [Phellopilus nigrolimitatus]|nr:Pre-mRNA-splicing factor of RES complex-domain-containing protein [Phellopilus nigrolimitatus]